MKRQVKGSFSASQLAELITTIGSCGWVPCTTIKPHGDTIEQPPEEKLPVEQAEARLREAVEILGAGKLTAAEQGRVLNEVQLALREIAGDQQYRKNLLAESAETKMLSKVMATVDMHVRAQGLKATALAALPIDGEADTRVDEIVARRMAQMPSTRKLRKED